MSGPVRPPLKTQLDNDTSENRPVNTIAFANTDFTLTNSGTKTTVALSGGGGGTIGGSIAANQVAFGTAADTIGGDASFTFDTTGTPKLKLLGTTPRLYLGDTDVSSSENEMLLIMKSGDGSFLYDRQNNTPSTLSLGANDVANNIKIYNNKIQLNDSQADIDTKIMSSSGVLLWADEGRDAVGILGQPSDDVSLHVFDNDNQDTVVRIESNVTGAGAGPILELFRNDTPSASDQTIGQIKFYGKDLAGTKLNMAQISAFVNDATAGGVESTLKFQTLRTSGSRQLALWDSYLLEFNPSGEDINYRIRSDGRPDMFFIDAGNDNIGIYSAPTTGLADNNPVLQVDGSISGKVPIIVTSSATSITLTNDQMSGHVLWFGTTSNVTITLPDGVTGDHIKVIMPSGDVEFQPTPSGQINGGVAGASISRNSAQNEILEFICVAANKWYLNNP